MSESINLNKRDTSAIWKTSDGRRIIMADMEDKHIQSALIIVQKRQVDAYNQLALHGQLEAQLLQECKNRNLSIQHLDEAKDNGIGKEYYNKKELIKTVFRSIKRKIKSLSNVKEAE